MQIRVIYNATDIPAEHKADYDSYTLLRAQSEFKTRKPGFIANSEIGRIAKDNATSKRQLSKTLDHLSNRDYVERTQHGYRLYSWKQVHNYFNIKSKTSKRNGRTFYPHKRYTIPAGNERKIVEALRLYVLIQQIFTRYNYKVNGISMKDRKHPVRPENFELGIEKIMKKGSYNDKMQVWRLINKLENVGLVKIMRGLASVHNKEGSCLRDGICSKYTLYPLSSAKWNNLREPAYLTREQRWERSMKALVTKSAKILKPKTERVKHITTDVEQKFYDHLNAGLQDVLVKEGVLSKIYKPFEKKLRKVSYKMIPKLQSYCLSRPDLRAIILTTIGPSQIMTACKLGKYYTIERNQYDTDTMYYYDVAVLVSAGGNFNPSRDFRFVDDQLDGTRERIQHFKNLCSVAPEVHGKVVTL